MDQITIIIPTVNEELNISKCIRSLKGFSKTIFVVDSNSSDKTKEISESLGAVVLQGDWNTFSEKINWAMNNIPIKTKWVMRIDADEILCKGFIDKWKLECVKDQMSDAYAVNRRFAFLGQEMRFGGWGGLWDVRIWKHGHAEMERRPIDEHLIIDGTLSRLNVKILDDNLNGVSAWIYKHNTYSNNEALIFDKLKNTKAHGDKTAKFKRFLKNKIYYNVPLLIRPFLFFIYRYFILLGFLDGRKGFIFHVLHSFWYRFLVDVKIFEQQLKRK